MAIFYTKCHLDSRVIRFRFSRNTPAGCRRARLAVRWNSEFRYAWLKTNSSSSFTTRFCGKGAIPILRCRSSTRRRHCIPTYGCAASTAGSTAPATGRNSTQCSTSMRCRARVGFQWPPASARKRNHLPRPGASTRRSSRQSTTLSIAVSSRPGALPRRRWVCTHRCIVDTGRQPAPHRFDCATAHA